MSKIKLWLEQTMMISFAILVGIILEGLAYCLLGGAPLASFSLTWLQLLSVVLTGALCSIPTLIWLQDKEYTKKQFMVRLILHCLGLYVIVSLFGLVFKWYTQIDGFVMMTLIFFMVYVFVWLVTLWFHKRDDNQINKALDEIRDEE